MTCYAKKQAVEALWDAILKASRADVDPIAQWDEHNANLAARCEWLNSLHLTSLHYHSANGTNLTVGMMENGLFCGGSETTLSGEEFNPNMPTEELFVTPKRGVAEGIVYSSKPLSYRGQVIDNFWIRFHEGKAVEAHAEQNDELLQQMTAWLSRKMGCKEVLLASLASADLHMESQCHSSSG